MVRTPVNSSNIASIGYDANTETLEVEFNSNHVYEYYGVPEGVYNELMSASSHGVYFAANIKNNYICQKTQ